jgi:hypothetical protein
MAVLLDEGSGRLVPLQNFSSSPGAAAWPIVPSLHPDGAMRYTVDHAGWQEVWEMPLALASPAASGGGPGWTPPGRLIASFNYSVPGNASASFAARAGGVPPRFPATPDGLVILLDASTAEHGGAHLGAVPRGGTALAWTASPWGQWNLTSREAVVGGVNCTLYSIDSPRGVYGAANRGTNYAAGYAAVLEGALIYNFFGEGWEGWEANQFVVFSTSGLFLGQCAWGAQCGPTTLWGRILVPPAASLLRSLTPSPPSLFTAAAPLAQSARPTSPRQATSRKSTTCRGLRATASPPASSGTPPLAAPTTHTMTRTTTAGCTFGAWRARSSLRSLT